MSAAQCKVSFTDPDALLHTVHVQAESLYEAVALAVSEFRADPLAPRLGPMTEFVVMVEKPQVEHYIRLGQVEKRAEATTREGPWSMAYSYTRRDAGEVRLLSTADLQWSRSGIRSTLRR